MEPQIGADEHCSPVQKPQEISGALPSNTITGVHVPKDEGTKNISNSEPNTSCIVEVSQNSVSVGVTANSSSRIRKGSSNSVASTLAKGTALLCFRMSDVAVSLLILLPLTIAMWRGIWEIMNHYTDPWVSIVLGNGLLMGHYFFQEGIKEVVMTPPTGKMSFPLFYSISRMLLFSHAFASINLWRGIWELLDAETGKGSESAIATLLGGFGALVVIKAWCNTLATPLFVGVDEATSIHDCTLAFKTPPSSPWKYFLDCLWSVVVIQNLVAAAWRGLWNLATIHLYPDDEVMSAILSLVIGVVISILLSILQPCYFRFMVRLEGFMRLAVFDLVTTWAFIACVLAWRGNWDLYNLVTVFESQLANEWLLVAIGTVGSIVLGCLSTVASRGITVDGEDSGDGSTEWPISYISLLQKKRHHGIPFPEPWLFRYFCTSQRMRMTEPLTQRRRSSAFPASVQFSIRENQLSRTQDDGPPLKLIKNSIYVDHFDTPCSDAVRWKNDGVKGQNNDQLDTTFCRSGDSKLTKSDNGNKIC